MLSRTFAVTGQFPQTEVLLLSIIYAYTVLKVIANVCIVCLCFSYIIYVWIYEYIYSILCIKNNNISRLLQAKNGFTSFGIHFVFKRIVFDAGI